MCGGSRRLAGGVSALPGLSPRVRGKLSPGHRRGRGWRSIPACAGEANRAIYINFNPMVYPRVCGGSEKGPTTVHPPEGLSPRVRGKLDAAVVVKSPMRSIPACAGEAIRNQYLRPPMPVYPRVCGGSPAPKAGKAPPTGLSPRVRGKHIQYGLSSEWLGSIPACAGEAHHQRRDRRIPTVYPRVCGGSIAESMGRSMLYGLSPRVRGKRPRNAGSGNQDGSIPACAGEA